MMEIRNKFSDKVVCYTETWIQAKDVCKMLTEASGYIHEYQKTTDVVKVEGK